VRKTGKSLEELGIQKDVSIIGLAKRLEEIYSPNDSIPLYIDKNSSSLKIIQNIRNEAHRFGINFHKLKRSNEMKNSVLDLINGVGSKTKDDLFKKFKSIEGIINANEENLSEVIGKSRAKKIKFFFSDRKN
jgi:excinuclease ABC subunit C